MFFIEKLKYFILYSLARRIYDQFNFTSFFAQISFKKYTIHGLRRDILLAILIVTLKTRYKKNERHTYRLHGHSVVQKYKVLLIIKYEIIFCILKNINRGITTARLMGIVFSPARHTHSYSLSEIS